MSIFFPKSKVTLSQNPVNQALQMNLLLMTVLIVLQKSQKFQERIPKIRRSEKIKRRRRKRGKERVGKRKIDKDRKTERKKAKMTSQRGIQKTASVKEVRTRTDPKSPEMRKESTGTRRRSVEGKGGRMMLMN